MASPKFYLRTTGKNCSIQVIYQLSRDLRMRTATGLKVNSANWHFNETIKIKDGKEVKVIEDSGRPRNVADTAHLRIELPKLRLYIEEQYRLDYMKGVSFNNDWLKEQINNFFNRPDKNTEQKREEYFLSDWIYNYLSNKRNLLNNKTQKPLAVGTIKSYKSTLSKLKDFEAYTKKDFRFEEVTYQKFYKPFLHYLREIEQLNENTSGKYITTLKTFLGLISDDERNLPLPLDYQKKNKFKSVSEETTAIYLSTEEIDKIFNLDLSTNQRLDNVRDIFIIGLWTGLRISDFKRLDISNITDNVITITTQKTNKKVGIGIHPQLKAVLDKRNGEFPKMISDQKFNEYVKEVVKIAEINELTEGSKLVSTAINGVKKHRKLKGIYEKWELSSSHCCRRSFATNMYKSKALPLIVLMSLTGHSTETQFIQYVKTTPEENAKLMNDYFNNNLSNINLSAPLKIA